MPVVDGAGNVMQSRLKTKEEEYFSKLTFPADTFLLLRLTPRQFRMWLYALEPREAMIVSCSPAFKLLSEMKLNKWRFIWRLVWE